MPDSARIIRPENSLKKTLGFFDVFSIATGAMISSGIFLLPGVAFGRFGPAMIITYVLAGICALSGMLATVELATAMPLAGGIYYYTGRSLGPIAGTISGLLNWCAVTLKSAFAIFGMAAIINQLFGYDQIWCGVILALAFLLINLISTSAAAWAEIIMVVILLAIMGIFICLGFPEVASERFIPFFKEGCGAGGLFGEAAFVFVSYGGLLGAASISEEVKNPSRNLPWGLLGSTVAVTLLYGLVLIVTVGAWNDAEMATTLDKSLTPLADLAKHFYGQPGYWLLTVGALMAFVTTANAGVLAASRFPFAMGRDQLIPEIFGRTYGKHKMPLPAILLTGLTMTAAQFMRLESLVTVASTVIMASFILTNISVIILRESGIQNYRPSFRMPFYPYTPLLCIILFVVLIEELGTTSIRIALGLALTGALLYFLFGRKGRVEYALLHIVYKLFRPNIAEPTGANLESELKTIIRERDGIVADEFDEILERAEVHTEEHHVDFKELALHVCEEHANQFPYAPRALATMLINRENASSTAISRDIAIPHTVLMGENIFHMVIVKAPEGIHFSPAAPAVRAAFFIFASSDRRNLHLKAIAAIAQIVQHPDFEKRWETAKTREQIRDLFLLAKRHRH